jgi:DNA-binding transcriptional MerR regulator
MLANAIILSEVTMGYPASVIPEKIFFKIGEVCDLVGVQAHVLRYWETEFPMLAPQKNRSGQRTYRRRDVEISLRVKELLYDELYTIAGAKKKLAGEMRETSKLKIVHPEPKPNYLQPLPTPVFEDYEEEEIRFEENDQDEVFEMSASHEVHHYEDKADALKNIAAQLLELRQMISTSNKEDENFRLRKY